MALEAAIVDLQRPVPNVRPIYTITETVSGFYGARIVTALSDNTIMQLDVADDWAPNNATLGLSFGCVFPAGATDDYKADFVASILQADADAPEASFNNVVDMLDWLNRD